MVFFTFFNHKKTLKNKQAEKKENFFALLIVVQQICLYAYYIKHPAQIQYFGSIYLEINIRELVMWQYNKIQKHSNIILGFIALKICEGNALYRWGNPVSVSSSFFMHTLNTFLDSAKAKAFTKSISYIAKWTLNSLIGIPWPEITWTNSRRKDKFGVYLCTKADAFLRNC